MKEEVTGAERVEIVNLGRGADDFSSAVRKGLTSTPKMVSPRYFYDELGAVLFEAICRLPEYYVSRAESKILLDFSGEIVASMETPLRLVELGCGTATKTRHVITAALKRQASLQYIPIDIDYGTLRDTADALASAYDALRITAIAAPFEDGIEHASALRGGDDANTLVLFLGSTLGNFEPDARHTFLRKLRDGMRPGDAVLVGADQDKNDEILIPAYDDVLGVTAAFNRNLLVRINRELGGTFEVALFRHEARYDHDRKRIEMHLISDIAQRVAIRAAGIEIDFAEGESIHTESSYKFTPHAINSIAQEAGFALTHQWTDRDRLFADFLLRAV